MPSQLIRNSVAELKRLKEEVTEITKQKMISEARQKIEEDAKALMEQILQDKADDEDNLETGEAPLPTGDESGEGGDSSPVLTTIPAGDDFSIDAAAPMGDAGENEVTPTVTTSTDDEGNVDIVIDTNPAPEGAPLPAGPEAAGLPTTDDTGASIPGLEGLPAPTEVPLPGAEELPNQEDEIEDIDMTNASAEEIMEKFCQSNQEGTLAEVSQVPNPEGADKGAEDPNDELASILDEAIELAKAGGADAPDEEEEVETISEEEMAELEKRINEDMLDDMNGGDSAPAADAPAPAGADTPQGELEETIAHNHTNGRHRNVKPSNFPEDKMRPSAVNEAAKAELLATRKQLAEAVATIVAENKSLKEQLSTLTTLNESLEGDMGQYRSKFYEAMLLSYKTGHVNKLLMEQTTTKTEKQEILESFLNAGSREEVSQLYENFEKKLQKGEKSTLAESKSVAQKLSPVFTQEAGSESAKVLNESRANSPELQKMMRIINFKY